MPAYFRSSIGDFLTTSDDVVISKLTTAYAKDGYVAQYTSATVAWTVTLPVLRRELNRLITLSPDAESWQLLLEYPLYRLRRRIDAVILTPKCVAVVELKTGASTFEALEKRQAEEYAQDLRDFHEESAHERLHPFLWAFEAQTNFSPQQSYALGVGPVSLVGQFGFADELSRVCGSIGFDTAEESERCGFRWDNSAYHPIPSVVEAAVTIFSGHSVREITLAGAKNLDAASESVFAIIDRSKSDSLHSVVFLTGVPGAGKTLAGLNIVHKATDRGFTSEGEVVYLSGNTPLVVVLREALARDQYARTRSAGHSLNLKDARSSTRVTIQHINDFLKEYVHGSSHPPSGHVIVFDEAQRAWDAKQGKEKFGRDASEPLLVLETMRRHIDWSVTVCLIGLGQEINDGEEGISGWADAIESVSKNFNSSFKVFCPEQITVGPRSTLSLGSIQGETEIVKDESLHLDVPMRSYRSPELGHWIHEVLVGNSDRAFEISTSMSFKVHLTRDLADAKKWLRDQTRGERRMGLLASSGARRLRADGLGEMLSATDGSSIAHWYLNPPGDIRSSFALEVPANEYTSQGLEVDFACLCWGGDLIRKKDLWIARSMAGNKWNESKDLKRVRFVLNSYRVLMSRAREGMIIWVPTGDAEDKTRDPQELDRLAAFLTKSGCIPI